MFFSLVFYFCSAVNYCWKNLSLDTKKYKERVTSRRRVHCCRLRLSWRRCSLWASKRVCSPTSQRRSSKRILAKREVNIFKQNDCSTSWNLYKTSSLYWSWYCIFLGVEDYSNRWVYKVGYTWSTTVKAAGTRVAYDHESFVWKDKVEIPGPTEKVLKLMVSASLVFPLVKGDSGLY